MFPQRITLADKAAGFVQSKLPIGWLERRLGIADVCADDLLTVLFTSGSEGEPKGRDAFARQCGFANRGDQRRRCD